MKRRDFITLLGGAAAVWPLAARAQQMRRIGVLLGVRDVESEANVADFLQVLQQLGWTDGTNVRIDVHWGAGDADTMRKLAAELAERAPDVIIELAARVKLPTVYYRRYFVASGGLISYGPDFSDQFRRAAAYVDRILKGEKPGDLPVQAPTKYELVINLKAAKALDLTVPPSVLARADEVIE